MGCQSDKSARADAPAANAPDDEAQASADAPINGRGMRPLLHAEAHFLNATDARVLLQSEDAFTRALSGTDRMLRVRSTAAVDDAAFRNRVSAAARMWSHDEHTQWARTINRFNTAMQDAALPLPPQVHMVRTDGQDEMGAHYTRQSALFFPDAPGPDEDGRLALFAHELFHVVSRTDADFRRAAYALIGARVLDTPAPLPGALAARLLTNPDGPGRDVVVPVTEASTQVALEVVPVLTLDNDVAAILDDEKWFTHIVVNLVVHTPVERRGEVLDVGATDYQTVMTRNTGYTIHPDEVLADNFRLVVLRRAGVAPAVKHPLVLDEPLLDALEALLYPAAASTEDAEAPAAESHR